MILLRRQKFNQFKLVTVEQNKTQITWSKNFLKDKNEDIQCADKLCYDTWRFFKLLQQYFIFLIKYTD